MIIVFMLTARSVAGLDIRVRIILKQHKVYDDYLNLPKIFVWNWYTAERTLHQHSALSSVWHYLIMSMTKKCLLPLP